MHTSIVLLAAGKGQRFNKADNSVIKQLALFKGVSLIQHTLNQLLPLKNEQISLYVTLGAHRAEIAKTLPDQTKIIASKNWSSGMGNTLAESIKVIEQLNANRDSVSSTHVMITLVDQPLIDTLHYQALINASIKLPNKIIVTQSGEQLMAPAIFPQQYFQELSQLQGDIGASKIIKKHPRAIHTISNESAQFDTDTPEQLAHVISQIQTGNQQTKLNLELV